MINQNSAIFLKKQKSRYIPSSTLILLAFSTAFFPRIVDAIGAPSAINFLHFATVPFSFMVALTTNKTENHQQIAIVWNLIYGLLLFLVVIIASALLNEAGLINVILDFLLLGEPFLLLVAIISTPMSLTSLQKFKGWILNCGLINLLLALIMWPFAYANILPNGGWSAEDSIQGVFYFSGAGNTVSASVSLAFATYCLTNCKTTPLWLRLCLILAGFTQLIVSDSKQIVVALLLSGILLAITNIYDLGRAILYLIGFAIVIWVFLWCVENLEAFIVFKSWMSRTELYGSDGEATLTKTSVFRIVPTYYESALNWLLGLGPGHTAGRLGGWMLKDYADLLEPLGSTIHPVSKHLWRIVINTDVAKGSTMFLPFFGWAGIWGDLGFLGLGAYLYLASIVWRNLCSNNMSRYLLLNVFSFGLIFTQMEEPGYMLFITCLIGLQWHESQIKINV